MAKSKTIVPFQGTPEQEEKLKAVMEKHHYDPGALVMVLQEAQEIYGYLPIEVQTIIADGLDMPLSNVYGVVSFYTQFSLNPKGQYNISICMGTACYVKGAGDILSKVKEKLKIEVGDSTEDGKFTLEATRCIGACGLAPVMLVNDDVYGWLVPDDVAKIIDKYE